MPLQGNLFRAGFHSEATQELVTPEQVPARATAIVWFADDYPAVAVVGTLGRLRGQRPGLRIIVVTAQPDDFTALVLQATGRVALSSLRKPALAAEVLEALGSHLPEGASVPTRIAGESVVV